MEVQDKEIWKDIEGFEGLYQVSNMGNVKSLDRKVSFGCATRNVSGKIIAKTKHSGGYLISQLSNSGVKNMLNHRLVAMAFIPNPDNKPEVNHIDGDKQNNCVDNLEWVTGQENKDHAVANGLNNAGRGESAGQSKLKTIDVLCIRSLLSKGLRQDVLSRIFKVRPCTISQINTRTTWRHV